MSIVEENDDLENIHLYHTHACLGVPGIVEREELFAIFERPSAIYWKLYRYHVFRILGRDCHYCGDHANEVDHIVPVARGGATRLRNLVPACKSCNSSKRDRLLKEWRRH